ncbi:MAG: DUF2905 domain-containing protein [Gemmatimonadaceae bacterium]
MTPRSQLWLFLVVAGLALAVIGALAWGGRRGALSWFGRLPGGIRLERPGVRFYAPITSMIIISVILSLLASLLRRFWS